MTNKQRQTAKVLVRAAVCGSSSFLALQTLDSPEHPPQSITLPEHVRHAVRDMWGPRLSPSVPVSPLLPVVTRVLEHRFSEASDATVSIAPTELDTDASESISGEIVGPQTMALPSEIRDTAVPPSPSGMPVPDPVPTAMGMVRSRSRSCRRGAIRVVSRGQGIILPVSEPEPSSPRARGRATTVSGCTPPEAETAVQHASAVRIRSLGRLPAPHSAEISDTSPEAVQTHVSMAVPMPEEIGQGVVVQQDSSNEPVAEDMGLFPGDDESDFRMNGSCSGGTFGADLELIQPRRDGPRVPALLLVVPEVVSFPAPCASAAASGMGLALGLGAALRDSLIHREGFDQRNGAVIISDDSRGLEVGWRHASSRIADIVRDGMVFYIGITENTSRRWIEHSEHGMWSDMEVLVEAPSSRETADLEQRLIQRFSSAFGCQNIGRGGERRSQGRPHYVYVLVGHSGLLRRSR